ncbi:MAG: hypothetical protein WD048_07650 [Chitinophagales bacterium]
MKNSRGFIELYTVNDYWKKLEFDFANLTKNKDDVYLAFNFFVTAYHLIDWVFQGRYSNDRAKLNSKPILRLCNHIASGIKHFAVDSQRHKSVREIKKNRYFEKGYIEEGYIESPIIIYLEDELKSEFGESIAIIDLAKKVMHFWKDELTIRNLIQ